MFEFDFTFFQRNFDLYVNQTTRALCFRSVIHYFSEK